MSAGLQNRRQMIRAFGGVAFSTIAIVSRPAMAQRLGYRSEKALLAIQNGAMRAQEQLDIIVSWKLETPRSALEEQFLNAQPSIVSGVSGALMEVEREQQINYCCGDDIELAIAIQSNLNTLVTQDIFIILRVYPETFLTAA